jgi:hypothetical protein
MNHLGHPLAVYTNNGTHFTGDDFHSRLKERRINNQPALKTHPQSVELSERDVQLVMNVLNRMVQGSNWKWDELSPFAVKAQNTRIVRVHGYTPAELLSDYIPRGHGERGLEDI